MLHPSTGEIKRVYEYPLIPAVLLDAILINNTWYVVAIDGENQIGQLWRLKVETNETGTFTNVEKLATGQGMFITKIHGEPWVSLSSSLPLFSSPFLFPSPLPLFLYLLFLFSSVVAFLSLSSLSLSNSTIGAFLLSLSLWFPGG